MEKENKFVKIKKLSVPCPFMGINSEKTEDEKRHVGVQDDARTQSIEDPRFKNIDRVTYWETSCYPRWWKNNYFH
jgi:hypothetical protein